MKSSASVALELDRMREVLAGLTETPSGRNLALGLSPSSDISWVRRALDETSEAKRLAEQNHRLSLGDLPDLDGAFTDLGIEGRSLPIESFVRVALLAGISKDARRLLREQKDEAPLLSGRAAELPDLGALDSEIRRVVDLAAEEVRDDASPELERIRKSTRSLEARLEKLLERTLSSRENAKLIQEPLVTTRNGRPVVPVKAECRSQFPGIVHGASASGATIFVEPLATVEVGNELAVLRDREGEEIRRILAALTERVRPEREALVRAVAILSELDLAQAKARLSELSRGEAPSVTPGNELRLEQARHPLLIPAIAARAGFPRPSNEPTPLSFGLTDGRRGLVFTGPNTGGKTVALKTAGLLALMVQSGLHVPASSVSRFPVLRSVFADIGDDQSIGSSLSTFSSHLDKVVQMERELELPALVILDEVGTGTDPAEGGALGTALVEHFLARGALVLASTHHGLLKAYAVTTEGVGAASFDFDPKTYAPTYRIVEGAAGRSLAFEMSERLGLPKAIVSRARALQSERERQVANLVSRLELESAELERQREHLSEDRRQAKQAKARLAERAEEEERERSERLRRFRSELEEELERTKKELRDVVAEAKRAIAEARAQRRDELLHLADLEKKLAERVESATAPLLERTRPEDRPKARPVTEPLHPGSRVLVATFGMEGEVERIAGDEAEVRVRDKRIRLPLATLEALPDLGPKRPASGGGTTHVPKPKQIPEELNLIGCTVEQALDQADKFLDDALLSEYRQVRLIHGHGTGRLKSALRDWLSGHPHVGKLESDSRGGVTVVELKD